jgi:hypothetical protein
MKNGFVADGRRRFFSGKRVVTSESIEKKYAAELASASPAEKVQIRARMGEEYSRRAKIENHKPSASALW